MRIGLPLAILIVLSAALIAVSPSAPVRSSPAANAGGEVLPGLLASFSDGRHTVRLITPTANFYLEPEESLHPAILPEFRAEWSGLISILETAEYRFDPGSAQLFIDEVGISRAPVRLTAGRHSVRILYERNAGPARLRLKWKSDHFVWEPVPSSAFFHPSSAGVPEQDLLAEQGRFLVEERGCVNCHAPVSTLLQGREGPDLTAIASRVKREWLYHWLHDPSAFRAGAVMPAMLDEEKRRHVNAYLTSAGATMQVARTSQDKETAPLGRPTGSPLQGASVLPGESGGPLPAEDTGAAAKGRQLYSMLGCAACHDQEGLSLDGLGSKTDAARLAAYLKNPQATDPSGRMPSFRLTHEEASSLAAFLVQSRLSSFETPVEGGDPERGRMLLESEGCLNCHRLGEENPRTRLRAPDLVRLNARAGCLADSVPAGLPRFRLSGDERRALKAFLSIYKTHPDLHPAPLHELKRKVRAFRCTACHELDALNPMVRLPEAVPPLTEVGAKLHVEAIRAVLTNPAERRNWIDLRMPRFDPDQVKPAAFAKSAGIDPAQGHPAPISTVNRQNRGINMIGNNARRGGLSCIKCHYWGDYKPLGEEAPQLIHVAERIRYEWFYRYILDPARIYSGTSMPAHFTEQSEEKAAEGIASLWAALSAAEDLPVPDGLVPVETAVGADARPVVANRPVIVRCFMPNATPAAIAVGLPGGLSYCFDAGDCRLRYAWRGEFIDLTENLLYKAGEDRYTPLVKVLGDIFYESTVFPFQFGEGGKRPEREFKGYRLIDGYPEFHYSVEGVDVHERILPVSSATGLERLFRVGRLDRPMWLLIPAPSGVRVTSDLGEFRNDRVMIPQGKNIRFRVRIEVR